MPQSRGRGGVVRLLGFVGGRGGFVLGSFLMANRVGGVAGADYGGRPKVVVLVTGADDLVRN